jgi:ankyrin repeat protein
VTALPAAGLAALLLCGASPAIAAAAATPDGTTALHEAVYAGDAQAVSRLLQAGADPAAQNLFGATPLMLAAMRGDAPVLRLLLDAGADVESPNSEDQTALMVVARTGSLEAAKLLLKRGANVHARESWGGQTALMWAAAQSQPEMIRLLARAALPASRHCSTPARTSTATIRMAPPH